MRARWLPLKVGGAWNPELRRIFGEASGVYAFRRKGSARVEYVGESHTGRGWKTLQRHFQDQTGAFADRSEFTATDAHAYECAVWATSQGARAKKNGDQAALDLQARMIDRYRPRQNRDDGKAYEKCPHGTTSWRCAMHHLSPEKAPPPDDDADFAFGANVKNPAVPPPNVAPEKRAENRTPDLFTGRTKLEEGGKGPRRDWKGEAERAARELAECRRVTTTAAPTKPAAPPKPKPEGYGVTDEKGQASMFRRNPRKKAAMKNPYDSAAVRADLETWPRARLLEWCRWNDPNGEWADAETEDLREQIAAWSAENEETPAEMRRRSRRNPSSSSPVVLGELVKLVYRSPSGARVTRAFREGVAVLAYAGSRLVIVFAPRRTGASSAAGRKEYARTHWGRAGDGDRLTGDVLEGKAPKLGTALEITYATQKGGDGEPVDYWHTFGDFGLLTAKKAFIPPALEGATVGGRQLLRLVGGTYTVDAHGIVG